MYCVLLLRTLRQIIRGETTRVQLLITMTFQQQNSLPSLPVPDLDETLRAYYKSVEIFLNEEQRKKTKLAIRKYRNSKHVNDANLALKRRASERRNWLEEWWYDGYLEIRAPLVPFLSIGAIHPRAQPMPDGFQLLRAAEVIYQMATIWLSLRRETYPVTKSRGVPWDMNQYYVLFNSNRIPQRRKDVLYRPFRLEREGKCPSHVTVISAGHLWAVETLDESGQLLSPDAIYQQLATVHRISQETPHSYPLPSLTAGNRDHWADLRNHVMSISKQNSQNMVKVEEGIFCLSLTNRVWSDEDVDNQLLHYCIAGDSAMNWADKTFTIHIHKDSRMTSQSDHSNTDAIAPLDVMNITTKNFKDTIWVPKNVPSPKPEYLSFDVDDKTKKAIVHCQKKFQEAADTIKVTKIVSKSYGNDHFRSLKIYGDTVVQMALQLAFKKSHGMIAPAYETASTRKFFHGRTETVRACTSELKELVEDIVTKNNTVSDCQIKLFKKAYDAHNVLMSRAMEQQGIDRHLLGIRKTIEEFGKGCSPQLAEPELYTDSAWKLSGGDGNFKLSTSFVGYDSTGAFGYVAAMVLDGYGVFYKINKRSITLVATSYKQSGFTNLEKFAKNVQWAFERYAPLLPHPNSRI
uniref:Carn_acyltransf domain-containing protein n=1 Tax=Steinernema glaseri TaxID=37863 RepID=A0A1I8AGB5_9BILA